MRQSDYKATLWIGGSMSLGLLAGCSTFSDADMEHVGPKRSIVPVSSALYDRADIAMSSRLPPAAEHALGPIEVAWIGKPTVQMLTTNERDCVSKLCLIRLPRYPVKTLTPEAYYAETQRCINAFFKPETTDVEIHFNSPVEGGAIVEFDLGGAGEFFAMRNLNRYEQYHVQVSYSTLAGQARNSVEVAFEDAKFAYFQHEFFEKPPETRMAPFDLFYDAAKKRLADDISKHLSQCVGNA